MYTLNCNIQDGFDWFKIVPLLALLLSLFALWVTLHYSRKNVRLSIQQAMLKTVTERVKDINALWKAEPEHELNNPMSPHFLIVSELVITLEVIQGSFILFTKADANVIYDEDTYCYILWKQLNVNLRGWFTRTKVIASIENDEIYSGQLVELWDKFEKHFP